jgi:glutaredoxin
MQVTVYSKPGCHLCEDALLLIDRLAQRYGLDVTEVNILDDPAIYEQYREIIPVVEVADAPVGKLSAPITERDLRDYFDKAIINHQPD